MLASQPHFHPNTDGNRFGFYQPPLVPPGTLPDLQALNNPFIAAQHEKERQLAASQVPHSAFVGLSGDFAHRPPPSHDSQTSSNSHSRPWNFFSPDQIDPSLRSPVGSRQAGQYDGAAGNGESDVGYEEDDAGYEGNTDDRSSDELDGEDEPRQRASRRQI